ncbi:LysR family transcriptional regulator [Rhodococcus sp. NPDC057014]|uniref:LysR family transcriptional regulator n=1 Tax=unclassified Rhodococcus (in: high G+C Gram-positive bacteria) TaxID=192944 RepID=UPI003629FF1C
MDWTLRELRYFVTACDLGSFTDAAAELDVSQAAVSRTIASLENRLGERLVRRTPRGCEPAALGQHVMPQVRRVLAEVAKLDEVIRTRQAILRVGYAWAAVGRHTTPLLRTWPKAHPDIDLQLVRHNSHTAGLAEGVCDAAIVRTPVDSRRFDSVVIGLERRMVAFASDDPEWRRRRQVTMSEIATRTIVIDPRTGTTSSELWTAGTGPERFVESTDVEEWLDTIAAGRGVGTTAEATASHHPRDGVTYRPISDGPRVPVHLAWWRHDPPTGLAALIDTLTATYTDAPR